MTHKMIHYKGYFLLALAFISGGAVMAASNQGPVFPLLAAGLVFWAIGSAKVALRNAQLKTHGGA